MKPRSGQVLIEYILMLAVASFAALLVTQAFAAIRNSLWMQISCEVIAPCPGCPPGEEIQVRANGIAQGSCRTQ